MASDQVEALIQFHTTTCGGHRSVLSAAGVERFAFPAIPFERAVRGICTHEGVFSDRCRSLPVPPRAHVWRGSRYGHCPFGALNAARGRERGGFGNRWHR